MSMELAILELAAAMREQAAAQRESNEVSRQTAADMARAVTAYGQAAGGNVLLTQPIKEKAAELAEARAERVAETKVAAAADAEENAKAPSPARQAIQQALDAAKADTKAKQNTPAEVKPDDELEAAATRVEEKVQKAKDLLTAKVEADAAPLDYKKDVMPELMKVVKAKGRAGLVDLLAKFGVEKGDQLSADQYATVVAEATKLAA